MKFSLLNFKSHFDFLFVLVTFILLYWIRMEGVREFLESSTIHGLIYISSSGTRLTKLFRFLVVVSGFTAAFVLINNSFHSWEKSPISISIETFPFSNITFPCLSVCPPRGQILHSHLEIWKQKYHQLCEKQVNKVCRLVVTRWTI